MRRGQIVATIGRGNYSTKPRPSLIVQADAFNDHHPSVTVCPITSQVTGDRLFRVALFPDPANGLMKDSEIEIDLVQAIRRDRIGQGIGVVSAQLMVAVDDALRRWLHL